MNARGSTGVRVNSVEGRTVGPVEEVRVCRACGHIDPADSRGRCPTCGVFLEFAIVPRPEAEQIARQRRRRILQRRVIRLTVLLAMVGGVTIWALGAYFDLGPSPPSATTSLSARLGLDIWGQIGRTPENSGFTPEAAPFPHQVAWTYRTSKPLLASPAVVDPHVYLTTGDGRTIALDRLTGQPVWEFYTGWLSSSTPAVAGESVIFAIRPGRVVSLNRQTGARLWDIHLKRPILASPVVVNGTVYIGAADKHLYALDAATGRQRWDFATQDWIVSAVAYAGDRVIVASQDSRIHVVGAETGRRRLLYETGIGRHIGAAPAVQGDRAYFVSVGGRVWAIDWRDTTYPLERGLLFWQTNLYLWGFLSTPPVQKGSVWSRRIGGDVRHTPALAHDAVYVTTSRGKVVALDAATGAERWQADVGVNITAAPTVAGATVLIGTESGVVFGLDAHTGERRWEFKTEGKITGSPIVAGDTMYVASHDGALYAVTGSE
jgi:eukaryotic-like serine/threonine-protein kinase